MCDKDSSGNCTLDEFGEMILDKFGVFFGLIDFDGDGKINVSSFDCDENSSGGCDLMEV
jgi:hypothetical protein